MTGWVRRGWDEGAKCSPPEGPFRFAFPRVSPRVSLRVSSTLAVGGACGGLCALRRSSLVPARERGSGREREEETEGGREGGREREEWGGVEREGSGEAENRERERAAPHPISFRRGSCSPSSTPRPTRTTDSDDRLGRPTRTTDSDGRLGRGSPSSTRCPGRPSTTSPRSSAAARTCRRRRPVVTYVPATRRCVMIRSSVVYHYVLARLSGVMICCCDDMHHYNTQSWTLSNRSSLPSPRSSAAARACPARRPATFGAGEVEGAA